MIKLINYGFLFNNWQWILYETYSYSSIPPTFSATFNGNLRDTNENNVLDIKDFKI